MKKTKKMMSRNRWIERARPKMHLCARKGDDDVAAPAAKNAIESNGRWPRQEPVKMSAARTDRTLIGRQPPLSPTRRFLATYTYLEFSTLHLSVRPVDSTLPEVVVSLRNKKKTKHTKNLTSFGKDGSTEHGLTATAGLDFGLCSLGLGFQVEQGCQYWPDQPIPPPMGPSTSSTGGVLGS